MPNPGELSNGVIPGFGGENTGAISKSGAPLANLPSTDLLSGVKPIQTPTSLANALQYARFQAAGVSGAGLSPEEYAAAKNEAYDAGLRASGYLSGGGQVTRAPVEAYTNGYISKSGDVLKPFSYELDGSDIPRTPPSSLPLTHTPVAYSLHLSEGVGIDDQVGGGTKSVSPIETVANQIIGYRSGIDQNGNRFQTPILENPQPVQKADVSDPFSSASTKSLSDSIGGESNLDSLSINNLIGKSFEGKSPGEYNLGNGLIDLANQQIVSKNQSIGLGNALADISNQQNVEKAQRAGLGNALIDLSNQQISEKNAISTAKAESSLKGIVAAGLIGNAKEFNVYNASGVKVGSIPANANSYNSLRTLLDIGEPISIRAVNPIAQQNAKTEAAKSLSDLKAYIGNAKTEGISSLDILGTSKIGGAFGSQGVKIGTTTPDNALRDVLGYEANGIPVSLSYQPVTKSVPSPFDSIKTSITSSPLGQPIKGLFAGFGATNVQGTEPPKPFTGIIEPKQFTDLDLRNVGNVLSNPVSSATSIFKPTVKQNAGFFNENLPNLIAKNPAYALSGLAGAGLGVGLTLGFPGAGKALGLGSDVVKAGENLAKETPAFEAITTKTARTYPTYAATNMMREKLPNDLLSLDTKVEREPVSATIPIPKNPQFEDVTHETISKSLKIQNDLLLPTEKVPMFKQAVPQSDLILKGETGKGGKPLFGSGSPIKITDHNTNEIANLYGKANGKAPIEKITDLTTNSISPLSRLNIGKQFTGSYPKSYLPPVSKMPKVFEQTPPEITNPLGRRGKPPVDITSIQEQGVKELYSDILNRQFKPEETLTASGKPGNINNPFINILEKSTPKISNGIKSNVIPTDLSEFFIRPGKIDTERLLGIEQPTIGESEGRLKDIMKAVNARNERENPSETTARTPINTPDIDRFVSNSQDFKKSMKDIGLDIKGMFTETKINLGKGIGFPYSKGGSTKLGFDINKPTNPFDALGPKNKPKGESKGKGNQFLIQIEKEATKTLENEVKSGGYREDNIALGTGKGSLIINQNTEKIGISGLLGGTKTDQANKKYLESLTGRKQSRIYEESQVIAFPQGTKSELTGKQMGIQGIKLTNDILQQSKEKQTNAERASTLYKLGSELKQRENQRNSLRSLNMFGQKSEQQNKQGLRFNFENLLSTKQSQRSKNDLLQSSRFDQIVRLTPLQTQGPKPLQTQDMLTVPRLITTPLLIPLHPYPIPIPIPTPPENPPKLLGGLNFPTGIYLSGSSGGNKKPRRRSGISFNVYSVNPDIVGAIEQAGVTGLQVSRSSDIYGKVDKQLQRATKLQYKGSKLRF